MITSHYIVVCIRFCAFFSLTMVLVSTVTFIISTIDELQMNDEGEVRLFFVVSSASFSFYGLNVRWSTLCCSTVLRSSTSSQSTSSPLSLFIFTSIKHQDHHLSYFQIHQYINIQRSTLDHNHKVEYLIRWLCSPRKLKFMKVV